MSGDSDQEEILPPRAPGPRRGSPSPRQNSSSLPPRPAGSKAESGAEPSTFRPSPIPAEPGGRAGAKPTASSRSTSASSANRPIVVESGPSFWERIFFGNVSSGQLSQFCRQFAGYLSAGVDILKTLSGLERQFGRTALGPALARIQTNVRAGATLEESMRQDERIFGPMFLSMIRVAEARGGLPETLKMLARHFEARQSLIRQARSAMIYPVMVLVIASGVVALITIFLLPMFVSLLKDLASKSPLPLPSRILMGFSSFMTLMGWWLVPLIVIGFPLLLWRFYKTEPGKNLLDRIILRIPVFGSLALKVDTTRFARTLSTLLDAGVDVGSSIDLTADVVMMRPIRDAILNARPIVLSGGPLSSAIDESRRFKHDVVAVITSGEETGKLPEALSHLADEYEEQVALMVKNMGQLVQPFLIVLLGAIVLFIILAVMLPYIQVLTSLAG